MSREVKPQKNDMDDIVREAQERMNDAWIQDRENREDSFSDLKFLAGDQWPSAIRLLREQQNRPCHTINRLPQFVHQIANNIRANPPSLKAIPTGGGATQELAKIYSGLFRQIQYRSNATIVFSQATYYAVAGGIGHFRIVTDYVDDNVFDQEILIKHIPYPNSVFWDPGATDVTRKDAEYCLVSDMIGSHAFETRFPDASKADFDYPSDINVENGLFWASRDAVRVCEYWKKAYKKRTVARLETGETIDITDVEHNEVSKLPILATRSVNSYEILQYMVSGAEVLDGPNKWAGRHIPIFPVIGTEVALESKIIRSGLIRHAKDAQQAYNFYRSAASESIALSPRAPFLVTPQMIAKYKGQWDTQNTISRPYLLYEYDGQQPGGPRREPPPDVPQAFHQESGLASDEMKATTGVYDAALGARSNEISGIAIKTREAQGNNATLHYQDNLVATLSHLGAALIDLAPKIYDADRTIAIMGDNDTAETVRINVAVPGRNGEMIKINDMSVGEYQMTVKMGPSYSTQRQEAVSSMMELFQSVPQAASVMGDIAVENMDFPGAEEAARRLKAMLPPQLNQTQPTPEAQQQQQKSSAFHDAMAQATVQKAQNDAAKSGAEALRTHVEAAQLARGASSDTGGGSGGLSSQDQSLVAGADAAHGLQQNAHDDRAAKLKNALLEYAVMEKQAHVGTANMLMRGRMLDNMRKEQVLTEPKTQPIP